MGVDPEVVQLIAAQIADVVKYQLDLGSMSNQASSIVARFKDRGITSVIAACDRVMLALQGVSSFGVRR